MKNSSLDVPPNGHVLAAGQNLATLSGKNGDNLTTTINYQVPITGTAYSTSTNTGATETMLSGANTNGNTTITIGGSKTTGDQLSILTYNPCLAKGAESLNYTVQSSDTLTSIASGLTSLINGDSALQSIGVSATSSGAVITIAVNGGAGRALTYDANGNMTSDGLNSYSWDAENRLIQVTYPGTGNNSQFTYDPFSQLVKIVETSGGSVTSTKQFVRAGSQILEERNASSAVTKQFFGWGQTISGSNYFYTRDHLGSVRDMVGTSGTVQAHYEYDMWGQPTQTVGAGTISADFEYASYYFHVPSGLNLCNYRAYKPNLGRWINRDPIHESGGNNLYAYVLNRPTNMSDPSGLGCKDVNFPPCIIDRLGCYKWCLDCGEDPNLSFEEQAAKDAACFNACNKRFKAGWSGGGFQPGFDPGTKPQTEPGNARNTNSQTNGWPPPWLGPALAGIGAAGVAGWGIIQTWGPVLVGAGAL